MSHTHGEPGSTIRGSRFVRDYCPGCNEPIRVFPNRVGCNVHCAECDSRHRVPAANTGLTPRQREGLRKTTGG